MNVSDCGLLTQDLPHNRNVAYACPLCIVTHKALMLI